MPSEPLGCCKMGSPCVFHPPTQAEQALHTKRRISLCAHNGEHSIVLSLQCRGVYATRLYQLVHMDTPDSGTALVNKHWILGSRVATERHVLTGYSQLVVNHSVYTACLHAGTHSGAPSYSPKLRSVSSSMTLVFVHFMATSEGYKRSTAVHTLDNATAPNCQRYTGPGSDNTTSESLGQHKKPRHIRIFSGCPQMLQFLVCDTASCTVAHEVEHWDSDTRTCYMLWFSTSTTAVRCRYLVT